MIRFLERKVKRRLEGTNWYRSTKCKYKFPFVTDLTHRESKMLYSKGMPLEPSTATLRL